MLECPDCDGYGCDTCNEVGTFELTECCIEYTRGFTQIANLTAYADKGMLPVAGTILDQPAWFMAFWNRLQYESNKIELERIKKR